MNNKCQRFGFIKPDGLRPPMLTTHLPLRAQKYKTLLQIPFIFVYLSKSNLFKSISKRIQLHFAVSGN